MAERVSMEPLAPAAIRERLDAGEVLVTTDIPSYLGRSIAVEADTSIGLYRLVQLFGTPNVPGLEAGADQPLREQTTWQYLFEFTVRPPADTGDALDAGDTLDVGDALDASDELDAGDETADTDPSDAEEARTHLVSVYDRRTNLSVGVAEFHPDPDGRLPGPEPTADPLPSGDVPDEADLELVVKLVLSTVEHAVEATYEGLHV